MPLQLYYPTHPLCHYVNLFWAWDDYAPPHPKERILPFGTMELNINLSDAPYVMTYPHDLLRSHVIHQAIVSGARSEFFVVDTSRPASLLSVWFKAGGALAFFGTPASELHNLHIPLHDLWGYDADNLYERLYHAKTTQARFELLEHFLCRRLTHSQPRHRAIDFSLGYLNHGDDIGAVVNQIALSPTRFIQLFKAEIGMTPKQYSQIQRFQRAVQMIAHTPHPNWADIALACGYYDQSHFINAFQRFAGISPSEYIAQDKDHSSNLAMS
jgi:AraC-like DNA-binding protein